MHFVKFGFLFFCLYLQCMEDQNRIIQKSSSKNDKDYDSIVILILRNEIDKADALIKKTKIDINLKDKSRKTLLHRAILCSCEPAARYFLKHANINVDIRDTYGYTSIHLAILVNDIAMVNLLLKVGANCTIGWGSKKLTPIEFARESNSQNMVDVIREFGDKKQAVFAAVKLCDNKQLINLAKQITFFLKDEEGNNPLHYLINYTNNSIDVFGLILWICPKLLIEKNYKNTCPIDFIAIKGENEILKKIIQLCYCKET